MLSHFRILVLALPRLPLVDALQRVAVFIKAFGRADYDKVYILVPPVEDGYGLKEAAVRVIFGEEDTPALHDVTSPRGARRSRPAD